MYCPYELPATVAMRKLDRTVGKGEGAIVGDFDREGIGDGAGEG